MDCCAMRSNDPFLSRDLFSLATRAAFISRFYSFTIELGWASLTAIEQCGPVEDITRSQRSRARRRGTCSRMLDIRFQKAAPYPILSQMCTLRRAPQHPMKHLQRPQSRLGSNSLTLLCVLSSLCPYFFASLLLCVLLLLLCVLLVRAPPVQHLALAEAFIAWQHDSLTNVLCKPAEAFMQNRKCH